MIVLSILTALALERGVVALHDADAARSSRVRIEAEIARDTARLVHCEQANAANVQTITGVLRALVAALKQGKVEQAGLAAILKPALDHFDVFSPAWQHDAWDTAIADQSTSHMAASDLRRYAEIYTMARDLDSTVQVMVGGDWLTHMAPVRIDMALGMLDGRSLAGDLARFIVAIASIDRWQQDLHTLIVTGHDPENGPLPLQGRK